MPEIKHTFQAGRMNKDLDERILPNGEYRDAMNIDLANSENGSVGAAQNILGNFQRSFINISGATCVGSIADTENEKIYFFINGSSVDAIAEYDQVKNQIKPVLVDTNGILDFSTTHHITGVNIIDGLLFFTDNLNEPKVINIDKFKGDGSTYGSINFTTHTTLLPVNPYNISGTGLASMAYNFTEEDVTVIKKGPINALTFEARDTKRVGILGVPGITKTIVAQNFYHTPSQAPLAVGEIVVIAQTKILGSRPHLIVGDTVTLKPEDSDDEVLDVDKDIRCEVVNSYQQIPVTVTTLQLKILNIPDEVENSEKNWVLTLDQEEAMFIDKFVRFSYRYKYKDGEYSTFAPFTKTVFVPKLYDFDPRKGYNIGMENDLRYLKLSGFRPTDIPKQVEEVDILYKEDGVNNVYVVDTVKVNDSFWTTNEYEIETELIYKTVESNQLLRPWDNVPRKAKAQELAANRIIYGNYLQNFNVGDLQPRFNVELNINSINCSFFLDVDTDESSAIDFSYTDTNNLAATISVAPGTTTTVSGRCGTMTMTSTPDDSANVSIDSSPLIAVGGPGESIKSQRTYQLGVVYRDEYGRETPVFTHKDGGKFIAKSNAINYNKFIVKNLHNAPNGFTHFKFFIKEPSNEYYNVAIDRYYDAEDGNIWISLPSSERNKIQDDTYLILKKAHTSNDFVEEEAKYRVLSISNEAPQYIKEEQETIGTASLDELKQDNMANRVPFVDGSKFQVSKEALLDNSNFTKEETLQNAGLQMRFLSSNGGSNYYKIKSFRKGSGDIYEIEIKEFFGSDIGILFSGTNPDSLAYDASKSDNNMVSDDTLRLELSKTESKNKPEFTGRFFIKLLRDPTLEKYILSKKPDVTYRVSTSATMQRKTSGLDGSAWRDYQPHKQGYVTEEIVDQSGASNPTGVGYRTYRYGNKDIWWGGGEEAHYKGRNKNKPDGIKEGNIFITFAHLWNYDEWHSTITGDRDNNGARKKFSDDIRKKGTKFRFRQDPNGVIYEVKDSLVVAVRNYSSSDSRDSWPSNKRTVFVIKLDKPITGFTENAYAQGWGNEYIDPPINPFHIDILIPEDDGTFTTSNPAVFETEPKENIDVDIYYEASDAIPIANHGNSHNLVYYNCYSFGNGVESNRIRDDFNARTIAKGVKASAVLAEQYKEERKKAGLIYSGIYNSTSSINRTNQFIQAEKITKELNPEYGSIQKLHTRNTDLIVCCEDKILRVLANKDALFNADGNANLTSTNNVLGQTTPFVGEYGISQNPESFAASGFRAYFSDKARGVILRLSRDGLTPISSKGMVDFFRDRLAESDTILGSYDVTKNLYNITFKCDPNFSKRAGVEDTISFSEQVGGWTSRKSFIPESGVSLNNIYYTFKDGQIYSHDNPVRNTFYNSFTNSSITLLLNDFPGTIKSFKTINYEGTQGRILSDATDTDGLISANHPNATNGWYVGSITTNLQSGSIPQFIDKEGKWFNYIVGKQAGDVLNLNTKDFNVQGIGFSSQITGDVTPAQVTITITENND